MCRRPLIIIAHSVVIAALLSNSALAQDARALLEEADRLAFLHNWIKAGPLYLQAEDSFTKANDSRNALYSRFGAIHSQMDPRPLPEVSAYLGKELLNVVVQGDPKLKLLCLVTKGDVDLEIDPATSQNVWEEVQTLAKSLGDKAWEARAKGKLAYIAFFDGEMTRARKLAIDAGVSAMFIGDLAAQNGYITLIAYAMNELKRYDEGLQFSDQALAMAESKKELGFPFRAYAAKAKALFELGKRSEATELLETGLEQTKLLRSRLYEAYFLIELGLQSKAAGSSSQAVEHLEAAGSLAREGGFYHSLAWSMFELARIYREQRELQKAEERAATALRAMRQVGDRYHLPLHLALSAELKMATGALAEADVLYEQATDVTEGMLANVPDLQTKSSLIAVMSDIYLGHFNLAANSLKNYSKAFRVIERARGRAVADSVRNRSAESAQKAQTAELSNAEKELSQLNQRLLRSERPDERRELLSKLWFEEQRIDPVVESPNQFQRLVLHKEPVSVGELRRSLKADELLLEYVLNEPASYCLVISREEGRLVSLAGRKSLEDLVDQYLSIIKSRQPYQSLAKQLYSSLVGPVMGPTKQTRLIVIPDGKLHLLPFDSLIDPEGKFILDSHVVSYSPSATVLHLLRTSPPRQQAVRAFLGIGAVPYEEPPRVPKDGDGNTKADRARGLFDLAGVKLQNLPSTRTELLSASQTIGRNSVLLMDEMATEPGFKSQPLGDFKILHLAVHGVADTKFPERAALVLRTDPTSPEDGLLQGREICALPLNASLVTLSACDAAIGRLRGQEGVANLVQSFLFAGAETVVASLWSADDTFTASLMGELYSNLVAGKDKGAALRSAKVELLKKFAQNAHPFYWAGFVMVGEGSGVIKFSD